MMTETMQAAAAEFERGTAPSARRRARAALVAEWIKLRSLRSMLVTLALTAVFCIGWPTLTCWNWVHNWPTADAATKAAFNPLDTNFNFVLIGVLFFGVLGALVVTNEYGNGLIRTTLAATPQRGLVLAAKTALLTLIALFAAAVVCFTAFLTGQGVLSGHLPHVTLADPGVLGHVLGAVFYMTAVGVMGVFIGALTRSTAVAMSGVFGIILVLPIMVSGVPRNNPVWRYTVPYLPSNLGDALWHSHADGLTSPTAAVFLLLAYIVVLSALAALSLRRRDA
jgi:ABC-2 type transport system permease protein